MPPVPAKRSRQRQSSKSMYCMSTLNRFSLAKSVVGRALKLLGTSKRLLLCLPPIILIFLVLFLCLPKGNDNFKEAYGDYLLTGQAHQNSILLHCAALAVLLSAFRLITSAFRHDTPA